MAKDQNSLPQFILNRGVPSYVAPPAQIVGLYSVSGAFSDNPEYRRYSVLTSEGWVPPVAHADLMLLRADSDGELHNLNAYRRIPTSHRRTTIDPRQLRAEIEDERIENALQRPASVFGSWSPNELEYYIPDTDDEYICEYIRSSLKRIDVHLGPIPRSKGREIVVDFWDVEERLWDKMDL